MNNDLIEAIDGLAASLRIQESDANGHQGLRHPDHAKILAPIHKKVRRIMARYFARQKKAILEDIRLRFHVGKEIREAQIDGKKRAEQLLPESLSPLNFAATPQEDSDYLSAIGLAISKAEKQLQKELDTTAVADRTAVSTYLEKNSLGKLTGDFAETTKQRLRTAIADAVDAGGTADDIVAAIQDTMDSFGDYRANLIAQTEVNQAYNFTRSELADSAGMTEKRWVTESGNPCQICEDNEAEDWIDFTEKFPSGDMFPGAHPGCMCSADYRLVTSGEGK